MFPGLDAMPKSILFWRSLTQWIGGLGILTFFLAISFQGPSAHRLFGAESHKIESGWLGGWRFSRSSFFSADVSGNLDIVICDLFGILILFFIESFRISYNHCRPWGKSLSISLSPGRD